MTLLTKSQLQTLDFAHNGQPFVQVLAKAGITADGSLDMAHDGQPFFAAENDPSGTPAAAPLRAFPRAILNF